MVAGVVVLCCDVGLSESIDTFVDDVVELITDGCDDNGGVVSVVEDSLDAVGVVVVATVAVVIVVVVVDATVALVVVVGTIEGC